MALSNQLPYTLRPISFRFFSRDPAFVRGWCKVFRPAIRVGSRVRACASPRGPFTREGAYIQIVRVLVTVSPLMYREAIAISLRQRRPDFEVRFAPSGAAEEEVRGFGPR
jgi:hypothetical protein